ncbi:hypothetical protein HDU96_006118 [Phlyctochytrium bullatum]|nr:hypothetical protein HDU96_006118 [Phlyctochytrium bullatum]
MVEEKGQASDPNPDLAAQSSTATLSPDKEHIPKAVPSEPTLDAISQEQGIFLQSGSGEPAAAETEPEPKSRRILRLTWEFIKKHWFLEGLAFAIVLAAIWPNLGKKKGIIRSEYTVKYGAVALIFILSGVSLKTAVLMKSLVDWKLHLVIQTLSLGVTPAIGLAVGRLLGLTPLNETLLKGLIIACSTPTTISSNVLMTKQASGNEAGALTNAVIGNIVGVFISPSLIMAYVGSVSSGTTLDYRQTFTDLTITVIAPLFVGQLIQILAPKAVDYVSKRISLAIVNSSLLLVLVWSVFCDTFSENVGRDIDAGSFVSIIFLDLFLFVGFSALAFGVACVPIFRFSREDTVAIVMCAATKTVALGIPMINIIYAGSPIIGILSAPLLIYHAEQLVVGSFMVGWFKKWVENR